MTDRLILANGQILRSDGVLIELTAIQAALLGNLWKYDQTHPGCYVHNDRQAVWLWGRYGDMPNSWKDTLRVHHCNLRHRTAGCSFSFDHKRDFGDRFIGDLDVVEDDIPAPRPYERQHA